MRAPTSQIPWYVDIRSDVPAEKMSLELARQLPHRALVGPVVIFAARPVVLFAVVKKRWSIIIREVERQYSSTLDRQKKVSLENELHRMRTFVFSANATNPEADIFFIEPAQAASTPYCRTICLADALSGDQLAAAVHRLRHEGLLVSYCNDPFA